MEGQDSEATLADEKRPYDLEVYPDAANHAHRRWRVWAPNGQNVGNGGEAYDSEGNAIRAFLKFADEIQRTAEHVRAENLHRRA